MDNLFEGAKEVTLSDEIGGVFSTDAEFDNERHRISISVTYNSGNLSDAIIEKKRVQLKELLRKELAERERQSYQKYLQRLRKDIRWGKIGNELYPHVTSILETVNPTDFYMDKDKLRAYAARGQVLDIVLQKFIQEGKWYDPMKELPETWKYLKQMKVHKLEMSGNLPGWVEKYKPVFKVGHQQIVNHRYKYVGEPDVAFGFLNDIPTMFELKNRSSMSKQEKLKAFKQNAAYANGENLENKVEQLCIIIINDDTKQGFSQPVVTTEIEKYFDLFLTDLFEFREMFNLEDKNESIS